MAVTQNLLQALLGNTLLKRGVLPFLFYSLATETE